LLEWVSGAKRATIFISGTCTYTPDHQKQGIGGKILDIVLAEVDPMKDVKLTTASANDFYIDYGFKPTDEWVTDDITREQVMVLTRLQTETTPNRP